MMQYLPPPRQSYSFPILKTDEIAKCLNELGISVVHDEITSPDKYKDSALRILELLSEICTGTDREELNQPAFAGLSALSFPELHDESIPQLQVFRTCCRMMEMCEIQDFTIKDFINPTANRFRRHLSGIINFAKFREERLVLLGDLSATRDALVNHMNQAQDRNDSLTHRLSLLKDQTAEESSTIRLLERECTDIETNMTRLTEAQALIGEETVALKRESTELKDNIAQLTAKQSELSVMKSSLAAQIVSSPEKFRRQIIEVGQGLQTEQKDSKAAERKLRDLSAWLVNVEEAQGEVTGALEAMQEVRLEADRQKSLVLELDSQKQTTLANRAALSELDQNVHQLHRHTTRTEEKLQNLRKQASSRTEDTQKALENIHHQLIEAEAFKLQVGSICLLNP